MVLGLQLNCVKNCNLQLEQKKTIPDKQENHEQKNSELDSSSVTKKDTLLTVTLTKTDLPKENTSKPNETNISNKPIKEN